MILHARRSLTQALQEFTIADLPSLVVVARDPRRLSNCSSSTRCSNRVATPSTPPSPPSARSSPSTGGWSRLACPTHATSRLSTLGSIRNHTSSPACLSPACVHSTPPSTPPPPPPCACSVQSLSAAMCCPAASSPTPLLAWWTRSTA